MEDAGKTINHELTKKYLAIVSLIDGTENRLKWSEIVFILMNLIIIISVMAFLAAVFVDNGRPLHPILLFYYSFSHTIGIAINAYWMASSTRAQLKLKLRYFQARYLERKLNGKGEYILSDESLFFNPSIGKVESPDGKETIVYPTEGMFRMDGFIGAARPRTLSLLMPLFFCIIYLSSLAIMIPKFFV